MKRCLLIVLLLVLPSCRSVYESDFGARPVDPHCYPGGLWGPVPDSVRIVADSLAATGFDCQDL
jgi:hypothetical protein